MPTVRDGLREPGRLQPDRGHPGARAGRQPGGGRFHPRPARGGGPTHGLPQHPVLGLASGQPGGLRPDGGLPDLAGHPHRQSSSRGVQPDLELPHVLQAHEFPERRRSRGHLEEQRLPRAEHPVRGADRPTVAAREREHRCKRRLQRSGSGLPADVRPGTGSHLPHRRQRGGAPLQSVLQDPPVALTDGADLGHAPGDAAGRGCQLPGGREASLARALRPGPALVLDDRERGGPRHSGRRQPRQLPGDHLRAGALWIGPRLQRRQFLHPVPDHGLRQGERRARVLGPALLQPQRRGRAQPRRLPRRPQRRVGAAQGHGQQPQLHHHRERHHLAARREPGELLVAGEPVGPHPNGVGRYRPARHAAETAAERVRAHPYRSRGGLRLRRPLARGHASGRLIPERSARRRRPLRRGVLLRGFLGHAHEPRARGPHHRLERVPRRRRAQLHPGLRQRGCHPAGRIPLRRRRLAVPRPERRPQRPGRRVGRPAVAVLERDHLDEPRERLRLHRPDEQPHAQRDDLLDGRSLQLGALLPERWPRALLRPRLPRLGQLHDEPRRGRDQDGHPAVPVLRRHHRPRTGVRVRAALPHRGDARVLRRGPARLRGRARLEDGLRAAEPGLPPAPFDLGRGAVGADHVLARPGPRLVADRQALFVP